jgi:HsdR family type I site-specific deoxyribonuclease
MKFTEEKLERAFVELLGNENYPHFHGDSIVRSVDEVLIEADLLHYLLTKYESKKLTVTEAKSIVLQLKTLPSSDLYESNKKILRWLSDGFILKREDRNQKDIHIELIDYNGLDAQLTSPDLDIIPSEPAFKYPPDYNIYKFVNQLEIVGNEKRIPDGIIYINGLPVVVFEFKSAIREEATIHDAFKQLTIRYRRDIPELFKYNAFCVISDGVNNKAGSFFAPYEFFYAWRRVGVVKLPLHDKTDKQELVDSQGIDSMFTMIQGMFNQNRLRDIIRNFIYFPDSSKKNEKIVCRYPQYYAAKRLYDNIKLAQKPKGDGKGGTYFGATGCGKSFTMLYLARLLMKSQYFESPTIVMITDRTDLDDQLSGQFTNAKKFIGDNTVVSVESRADLRDLIQCRQSGGVFLTTIHKFTEDTQLLSDRTNVICISDEAHRSQVNLDQKIKVTENGVTKTFGFAKYLHDSLPNATFVGFTGTPIDATLDVFGKVVDAYTMTESVRDEITVRIVYEGRAAKIALKNGELEKIEKYYEEAALAGTNEYQIEESKIATANMNAILGDPDRLRVLADDFVKHYENRVSEGATVKGKAMFVCSSREIAYELYKNVIALLGERSSSSSFESLNYASSLTTKYGKPEEWHTGHLPHREKVGLVQFITFRLADSLPQNVLIEIENELKNISSTEIEFHRRKQYEKWLDNGLGCCALSNPDMAQVVQDALKYHDGEKYNLLAWSIMPNHVHVLIKTKDNLSKIIQSWKSFTGKWALANSKKYHLEIPAGTSEFWMPEYWDRFIRDEDHFNNTIKYILNNSHKANLPKESTAFIFKGCTISDRMKQELHPSQIKMIMTRGQDDDETFYKLLGTKDYRKELDRQFKNEKSNFKIAIVVDMWLTGFDVPFLDTMYIDKPIQQHNLIQTISRVNRKFEGKNKGLVVDYIGIKKQMNMALAKYNKGDKDNFEDIAESVIIVRNHLDLLAKLFHQFDSSKYFHGTNLQQLNTLNMAAEFAQKTKDIETRFMGLVKRLKAAYDICAGSEQITSQERDYTHFYLAVRSIVFKLTKGNAPDTAQMNARVREMIKDALESDGVQEIFKLGDDSETGQDLFDEDYLAKIAKIKLPNTKIKLLQQLLAKVIAEIKKVNKVKGVDFTRKMQVLVERYNQRDESDVLRSEVYEEMAEQLTNLIWEVHQEFSAGDLLGIDFEEKAFYDILKELCVKYDFNFPEDKLIELAKAIKELVESQAKFPDWNKRDDIKSALKVGLILLLDEFGYPPVERDEVYVEIFEQAENFKKNQLTQ